ncbi:hypothetical protein BY458DRAFT_585728 [Sporodiniella umbellata]|nr:hypothetical protein BY458DRAFT_585728 [Sporodiniella umbellata]
MPYINNEQTTEKYRLVEKILKATDYYQVLGIDKDSAQEEIRRAYIKKSRICHPDKFVPSYPPATQSFQSKSLSLSLSLSLYKVREDSPLCIVLSIAYETLIHPSAKLVYDLSNKQGTPPSFHAAFESFDESGSNETLQRVLQQVFNEMLEGESQTLKTFIYALNETSSSFHITEDAIQQIELAFKKMRELFQSTRQYYQVIQFELLRLYELQYELRQLSYFSVWRRMQLTITICKILLQLPILINTHAKQKPLLEDAYHNTCQEQGLLNQKIESALKMAVGLLETSERYAMSW